MVFFYWRFARFMPRRAGILRSRKSVISNGGGEATGGNFSVRGSIGQPVLGTSTGGNFELVSGLWAGGSNVPNNPSDTRFDLDGDGKTDIGVWRPGPGEWWYLRSIDGIANAFQFGSTTDTIVPADFTGDGATDVAFWRESSGQWVYLAE